MAHKRTSSPPKPTLGATLAAARRARGISQADVAVELGITQEAVSRWETGANGPSRTNLGRLATLLELELAELVALEV